MGEFVFQMSYLSAGEGVHSMGSIGFDGGVSKKIIGWGGGSYPPMPSPRLWVTLMTMNERSTFSGLVAKNAVLNYVLFIVICTTIPRKT